MNCTNKYFRAFSANTDVALLKKYKHSVYVNTGQDINLIFLTTFADQPYCLFIHKNKKDIYLLKSQFSPSLFRKGGTIFEGEIVDSLFLISDFLVYMGKDLTMHNLTQKISLLKSIVSKPNYHSDPELEPFTIQVKDFVEYKYLKSFSNDYLPTLPYYKHINGLIFRPNQRSNKNIIFNFNKKQSKLKFATKTNSNLKKVKFEIDHKTHPKVNFMLFETGVPDNYVLKLRNQENEFVHYGYALANDMKTSKYLRKTLEVMDSDIRSSGVCVECKFHPVFKKWKPLKILDNCVAQSVDELK
jgi:hypothetical protein